MNNYKNVKKEIQSLIQIGGDFYEALKKLKRTDIEEEKFVFFQQNYELWYSKSVELVSQILPTRLKDFILFYKNEKEWNGSYEMYTISLAKNLCGSTDCGPSDAAIKMLSQVSIIKACLEKFDSKIYDLKGLVQADIFDSELDSAKYLFSNGFFRPAGAICGVIIEKHFFNVCENHNIIQKPNATISVYNELLKENNLIQIEMWRFIQRIGDLRNLCVHGKDQEPTKENIQDLLDGTDKIIKTVF